MSYQMAIPFAIDASGSVATVTNPVQALGDRVRALAGTHPDTRVMRSSFGVDTTQFLFSWDANASQAHLQQAVAQAVGLYEPQARVLAVRPILNPDGTEILGVDVDVSSGDPVTTLSTQYSMELSSTGEVSPDTVGVLNPVPQFDPLVNVPVKYGDIPYGDGPYGGGGDSPYAISGYGEGGYGGD